MLVNDMFRGIPPRRGSDEPLETEMHFTLSENGLERARVVCLYAVLERGEETPVVPYDEALAKVLDRGIRRNPMRVESAEWVLFQSGSVSKGVELRPVWIFSVAEYGKEDPASLLDYSYYLVDGITGEVQIGERM